MVKKIFLENSEKILGIAHAPKNHVGIKCNGCKSQEFGGLRYKCVTCKDLDYCARCWRETVAAKGHNTHLFWVIKSHIADEYCWDIPIQSNPEIMDSGKLKNKVDHNFLLCLFLVTL